MEFQSKIVFFCSVPFRCVAQLRRLLVIMPYAKMKLFSLRSTWNAFGVVSVLRDTCEIMTMENVCPNKSVAIPTQSIFHHKFLVYSNISRAAGQKAAKQINIIMKMDVASRDVDQIMYQRLTVDQKDAILKVRLINNF